MRVVNPGSFCSRADPVLSHHEDFSCPPLVSHDRFSPPEPDLGPRRRGGGGSSGSSAGGGGGNGGDSGRLGRSARIAWMVCDEPWKTKECLIRTVSLLLNLDQNRHHLFHSKLSEVRREAKARARELPIAHRQNDGLLRS